MILFEKAGAHNTEQVVEIAVEYARNHGIQHIVVATNTGKSAERLLDRGLDIVCVTHHVGFTEPGVDEIPDEIRCAWHKKNIKTLTTTHLMGGIGRGVNFQFGGYDPGAVIAQTLRMFGQGVKVGVEIAVMALDAGLIPYGDEVIAIGGSGYGEDAAIVVKPAHAKNFFDTQIRDILCKPRDICSK